MIDIFYQVKIQYTQFALVINTVISFCGFYQTNHLNFTMNNTVRVENCCKHWFYVILYIEMLTVRNHIPICSTIHYLIINFTLFQKLLKTNLWLMIIIFVMTAKELIKISDALIYTKVSWKTEYIINGGTCGTSELTKSM